LKILLPENHLYLLLQKSAPFWKRFSLSKKSLGLLRAAALKRLSGAVRLPVSGGSSVLFAAREPEGREAKSSYPVKKQVF